jgi:phage antirepressor YoqD-like protein
VSKEIKIKEKDLLEFIRQCRTFIDNYDKIMKNKESVERGRLQGKNLSNFNFAFDSFLHFTCKIPFSKFKSIENKTFKISKYFKED